MRIELANGTIETPVGETVGQESIELGGVLVNMRLPIVKSHGAYGILLGRDWLRRVSATADYRNMVYRIKADGKRATIKQNRGSCEVLSTGEDESDSGEESSDSSSSEEESDHSQVAHMAMVVPLDGYQATARTIATATPSLGTPYTSPGVDHLLGDVRPDRNRADHIIGSHDGSDSEFNIGSSLTAAERSKVMELLHRHPTVFATELDHLESTDLIEHQIRVKPDVRPVYRPGNKRFAQPELKFIKEEVERQLKAGIIREHDGPWCAPVTLGLKKSGAYRFCVAYVGLNAVTERESWPLPNLEEVLERMGGHEYYTTFDGFSGFNTVPICKEDQHYTTFRTPYGTYCYTVMPFGLKNAPHTYCRYVQKVFAKQVSHSIETYMDDCAVMSMGFDTHCADVEEALNLMEQGKMKVNPWKSHFFQRGVEFLGHYMDRNGVSVLRDRVRQIEDWLRPTNVREIRAFLGFCGYYRRFVRNYSTVAAPLVLLTRQTIKWRWGKSQARAFNDLKDALSSAPVLAPPDYSKSWIVDCDASNDALGAVLSQVGGDGIEHPV